MLNTKTYLAAWLALLSGPGFATEYQLEPAQRVVGEDKNIQTVYEDTLYDLARQYSLGSEELIRVNPGVDPWIPGADKTLLVPGIPEASDENAASEALDKWLTWISRNVPPAIYTIKNAGDRKLGTDRTGLPS